MAEYPYLSIWTDALIGDTYHLTPAQFGAYMRLLIAAWRRKDCALPNDDVLLGRWAGDTKNWYRLKPIVMPFWDLGEDGFYRQKRLQLERNHAAQRAEQASAAGRASALKRKETGSTGVQPDTQRKSNTPTPTPTKKDSVDPKEGSTGAEAPDPRKLIYDLGKHLLGKSAGGQITKICKQEGGDMGRALSVLLKAQLAASPEEYIGAYLRDGKAGEDGLDRAFRKIRSEVRDGNGSGKREATAEVLPAKAISGPGDLRPDDHLGVHALFSGDPHEGD